jgi:hypothetical protein
VSAALAAGTTTMASLLLFFNTASLTSATTMTYRSKNSMRSLSQFIDWDKTHKLSGSNVLYSWPST